MNQEERHHTILENLPHAYAYHKIVTDNKGIPVDYTFLEVNKAFEKMTGLQRDAVIGKKVTEVLPGIKKDDFDWISTYGKVALTGDPVHFETYSDQLNRWYEVCAFSDKKGFFAVTFHEVTHQRNEKPALERLIDFGQKNLKSPVGELTYQTCADDLLEASGAKFVALNAVLESIKDGISVLNTDLTIRYTNSVMKNWYAKNLPLEGRHCYECYQNSEKPCSSCPSLRSLESGKTEREIVQGISGSPAEWLEVFSYPIKNQTTGEVTGIVEFVRDVTEQKRAEESLKENEAFIRAVMDNLPIGIAVNTIEPEVNFTYMNDNFARFYRTTREALTSPDAFWNVVYEDPAFRDQLKKRILADCATGNPEKMHWEDVPITRGGQVVAYISAVNIPIPETKLMISTVWDVTNRKQTEEAYQESEERYRKLFEESPVALFEEDFSEVKKDMDLLRDKGIKDLIQYFDEHPEIFEAWVRKVRILKANQEAKRLFGINIDAEIPAVSEHEALGPVSRIFRHEFYELFSGHTKTEYTGQAQDFDGNLIHVVVRLEVVDGHEDKLDRVLVSIQDLTEQVHAREELERSYEKVQESFLATVHSLAAMSELRDPYTAGHQKRVAQLAAAIAKKLNLDDEIVTGIRVAGLLHDIGKLQIPAEILSRPGRLTDIEFNLIKEHPSVVPQVLKGIDLPWPVAEIAYQHHERLDGSGYPRGLKKNEIMMEARILGVADVVEAMSSHRPYRPAHKLSVALDEIRKHRDSKFDPAIVDACIELFEKNEFEFEEE